MSNERLGPSMDIMAVNSFRGLIPRDMIPLGFGCGGLLCDGLSPADSLRLVETALDCGITYFDTARMYGHGGAEGVLGKHLPRHRHRIVLTSKAGILPPNRSVLRRLTSRGVEFLHDAAPGSKAFFSAPDVWKARFGVIEPKQLRKSVETSLRELRTDYLDILLLHECTRANAEESHLLDFLEGLKKQGIIREFGLASGIDDTLQILKTHPVLAPVVQIPSNIWTMNTVRLPPRPEALTITHSCLTSRFRRLLHQLSLDRSLASKWRSMTNVDPRDTPAMARLLLAHSLWTNRGGIALFSSSRPEHICSNVKLLEEAPIDETQLVGLCALLGSEPGHFSAEASGQAS
jgi:D-threo-aldose 1-dehydrogenase